MRIVFGNGERSLSIESNDDAVTEAVRALYPQAQLVSRPEAPSTAPATRPETQDGPLPNARPRNAQIAPSTERHPPSTERHPPPADLVVESMRDGGFEIHSLLDPDVRSFATLPDLLSAVEFGLTHFLLIGARDKTHLHAAGAVLPGSAVLPMVTASGDGPQGAPAVLALGPSGSGKSSIALFWSRAGLPLLGDDVVLLDDAGVLGSFPRTLKAKTERFQDAGVGVAQTHALLFDEETREARYDPAHGAGWAGAGSRPRVIARVRHEDDASVGIHPLADADALRLLMDSVLDTGRGPHESFPRFAELLGMARFVDVVFGRADEAARALAELAG